MQAFSMLQMKSLLRTLLPLTVLAVSGYAAWWLYTHQPVAEFREMPPSLVRVEGTVLRKTTHQVIARSQGMVQPRTRSTILPEVGAKVIEVGTSFRPGGFFEKDEVLLKLDPVDYETALVISKAALAQAESMLAEEEAKAEQAKENWKALGRQGEPGAMVIRLPQVTKAKADVASAKAQILKSERDLERTVVRAPYAGQVLEQNVDVGQLVTQGTTLGKIFAVDYVEIRLPLPEREMRFLTLPEHFRDSESPETLANVKLKAVVNGKPTAWTGKIVRVESALDESTRQAVAVAQVNDPYARREDGTPPLKIGQFVEAQIEGQRLTDVFIIPRNAVRAGNEIILITPESRLRRMNVEPLAGDEKMIVIAAGVPKSPKEGDVLCLTPIPFPADGARVLATIDGTVENPDLAGPKDTGKKAAVSAVHQDKAS
jgi:RND family efflux transporter MFP subunit